MMGVDRETVETVAEAYELAIEQVYVSDFSYLVE